MFIPRNGNRGVWWGDDDLVNKSSKAIVKACGSIAHSLMQYVILILKGKAT
jgi:hypothetical protein